MTKASSSYRRLRGGPAVGVFLAVIAVTAGAQVTRKPVESDPVRVDGGLVSGTYLASGVKAYLQGP